MKQPQQFERQDLEKMTPSLLVEIILRQQEATQQLFEEVARLKAIINRNSSDSSKPPSSDFLKKSEKAKVEPLDEGKRKPGGQPGHQGTTRKGFGRVDRFEKTKVESCPNCGSQSWIDMGVKTRQTARLVKNPIEIVEYEQHQCRCQSCETVVWGEMPSEVIGEQDLEASLQGMLAWLGTYAHMSYEKQQEWLVQMGVEGMGIGTLAATTERVAVSVRAKVEELADWIKTQIHTHVDETGWPVKGVKEWLWSFSGEGYALYRGADTRSRAELEAVLGEHFAGVLSSDDYSVYNGYAADGQQKCLAHLLRHFKQLLKLLPKSQQEIGRVFIKLIDEAFAVYRKWQKTQDNDRYFKWAEKFKEKVSKAIEEWMPKAGHSAGKLLKNLRDKSEQWWYFLKDPKIPPDNNRAERNLRLAVTKRKVCGGSRSMDGLDNTAALLTVIQTCKAQGKSALEFFRQALIDPTGLTLIPPQT
jgi:transposase